MAIKKVLIKIDWVAEKLDWCRHFWEYRDVEVLDEKQALAKIYEDF